MQARARRKRVHAGTQPVLVCMNNEPRAGLPGDCITELDHGSEFPRCVDVQQRERQRAGVERLAGKMQQDRRVLADGVEQHGIVAGGDDLAEDKDALGLKPV